MFEYWSWKEKALVIGLAVLAAVFAYVAFSTSASLQSQIEKLQTENFELQKQIEKLRNVNAMLSGKLNASALSAFWEQRGELCVLKLHVPTNPGWWEIIRRGNLAGAGGYFALVLLVDDDGIVVVPGALRFYNATAEVWFACSGGRAVGVYASTFEYGRNSFHMFIPYDFEKGQFLTELFPCGGLCGKPVPLLRPITPKHADVLLFFYPPGVNGLDYILYEHGYAVRLNVTAVR